MYAIRSYYGCEGHREIGAGRFGRLQGTNKPPALTDPRGQELPAERDAYSEDLWFLLWRIRGACAGQQEDQAKDRYPLQGAVLSETPTTGFRATTVPETVTF